MTKTYFSLFLSFCLNTASGHGILPPYRLLPILHGGCITGGNQTIAVNAYPGLITASTATGGSCSVFTYQWQISLDNIHFYTIPGATEQDLSYSYTLSQTTYFQRKTTCGAEVAFTNTATVIIGPPCSESNCSGDDRKCIGGLCEIGNWVVTSSVRKKIFYQGVLQFVWVCTYHYCFSDGSISNYYNEEYNMSSCAIPYCGAL